MKRLADSATVSVVAEDIDRALAVMADADEEPEELAMPDCDDDFQWESGVEDFQHMPPEEVMAQLGLGDAQRLPTFNEVEDRNGIVDPWTKDWEAFCKTGKGHPIAPRWHQWVGALGMMLRVIRDGVPVLLLDDVGIGKTMQVLMVIALYQLFRRHREKHGRFPGAFGEFQCSMFNPMR